MTSPNPSGVTVTPPGWNDPHNYSPYSDMQLVASTGVNGFTLVNGTPNILTWTAPNDGQMHRVSLFGMMHVTSTQTGGAISFTFTHPDGSATPTTQANAGGQAAGSFATPGSTADRLIQPGSTFTLFQSSAQTAGACVYWAELWAQ